MEKRIRELERMLENEILKEAVKKTHLATAIAKLKRFSIRKIAEVMEVIKI